MAKRERRETENGIRTIRNRDGSAAYKAIVRRLGHAPIYKTFDRRTDAKAFREKMLTELRAGAVFSREAERTLLKEALERYLREVTPLKKGKVREEARIKQWMAHPYAARFLSKLRGSDFAKYRDELRAKGKAENTIRIMLALISRLYKVARKDWGMEGLSNPIENMTLPGGSNRRDRRLEDDEQPRLLAALRDTGPYDALIAELAIESAMRQGEMFALTWDDVDLEKRTVFLKDTKNGDAIDVPLSSRAVEILKALPRPIGKEKSLFPFTADALRNRFERACEAAAIEDLVFHDLRHEATSRLFERGLNIMEVQRITRHKSLSQLMRYTHLKAEDVARKLA